MASGEDRSDEVANPTRVGVQKNQERNFLHVLVDYYREGAGHWSRGNVGNG